MRQRDSGSRPNKRHAGNVFAFPGRHRSTPSHKREMRLDHVMGVTPRSAIQIIGPRGLGKALTINHLLHDFAYVDMYVLESSGRRVVLARAKLHVVADPYSGLLQEVKCVTEKTSTKSTEKTASLSPRVKSVLEKYFTGLRPIAASGDSPGVVERDRRREFSAAEARAHYQRRGIVIHYREPSMSQLKKETGHAKDKAKKPRS